MATKTGKNTVTDTRTGGGSSGVSYPSYGSGGGYSYSTDPADSEFFAESIDRFLSLLEGGALLPDAPTFPEAPPERDLTQEALDTLAAQQAVAPGQWDLTKEYLPRYAALNLGIAALSQPVYDRMQVGSNRRIRQGDLADLESMGPEYVAALRAANPEADALLSTMYTDAMEGLETGGLPPDLARDIEQASRAGYADRGLAYSNPAILDEVTKKTSTQLALEDRARNYAGTVLGYEKSYVDPMMAVLGRPSSGLAWSNQLPAGAAGTQSINDPFANQYAAGLNSQNAANANSVYGIQTNAALGQYGTDVNAALGIYGTQAGGYGSIYGSAYDAWNTQYNAAAAQEIAQINASAAVTGGLLEGVGSLFGGWLGAPKK